MENERCKMCGAEFVVRRCVDCGEEASVPGCECACHAQPYDIAGSACDGALVCEGCEENRNEYVAILNALQKLCDRAEAVGAANLAAALDEVAASAAGSGHCESW